METGHPCPTGQAASSSEVRHEGRAEKEEEEPVEQEGEGEEGIGWEVEVAGVRVSAEVWGRVLAWLGAKDVALGVAGVSRGWRAMCMCPHRPTASILWSSFARLHQIVLPNQPSSSSGSPWSSSLDSGFCGVPGHCHDGGSDTERVRERLLYLFSKPIVLDREESRTLHKRLKNVTPPKAWNENYASFWAHGYGKLDGPLLLTRGECRKLLHCVRKRHEEDLLKFEIDPRAKGSEGDDLVLLERCSLEYSFHSANHKIEVVARNSVPWHPGIANLLAFDDVEVSDDLGRCFMVTEYVPFRLDDLLYTRTEPREARRDLTFGNRLQLLQNIALAVQHLVQVPAKVRIDLRPATIAVSCKREKSDF